MQLHRFAVKMWSFAASFLILISIILIHVVFPKRYHWPSTWKKLNKIPGPVGLPFLGNALSFLVRNEEVIPLLMKFTSRYGPIWRVSVMGYLLVFLTDLDDVEVILNSRSHIAKGSTYEFLLPWLGTGLLISTGKKWADHRKQLTPAFHFGILEKQYMEIMNKNADILVKVLREQEDEVAVNALISHCALDIICETAMGVRVNALTGGRNEYVTSVLRLSQIFIGRTLKPWLHRPWVFRLSPMGREHDRILKTVHGFTEKVIKERQAAFKRSLKSKESKLENPDDTGEKQKRSFLDLLIEISHTQNSLTEEEIREEVNTFMFEGHDTTATAVSWAIFELGAHPEVQEKAYREQMDIFDGTDREISFADLQEMKYLERVIKETLRLFPSVPIMSRMVEEDVRIGKYVIPAQTEVPIITYCIHRNPKIYPDPEKFNPDRFLPDALRDRHPYSYIPFSAGPRNCIGQRFAMMEEKILLSHIIRNFKVVNVTKPEDIKVMGEVILRPKENLKVIFEKRKHD